MFPQTDTVIFVSDKRSYTKLYRSSLFSLFNTNSICLAAGFFDSFSETLKLLYLVTINRSIVVVSNIKSNIIVLLLPFSRGLMILNGLGRFRTYKIFRILLLLLMKIRKKNFNYVIQNYKDFRYFRRYFSNEVIWILGSGGRTYKTSGTDKNCVSILTRASKFQLQTEGLRSFVNDAPIKGKITIYGSGNIADILVEEGLDKHAHCQGWKTAELIFAQSSSFCCLPGYGEGIPHSLVDAICSGLPVWISTSDFRDFGFYTLEGIEFQTWGDWRYLNFSHLARSKFHFDNTNAEYMRAFKQFLSGKV